MMQRTLALLVTVVALLSHCVWASAEHIHVGYALFNGPQNHEDSAAISWLTRLPSVSVHFVQLGGGDAAVPVCDLLWVHLPDSLAYKDCVESEHRNHALRAFVRHKGVMLCTGYAAFIANDLGLEPVRPTVRFDTLQNDWLWDKKGFQSHRGHPLFAGLFGGDYVWDARVDQILPIIGYYGTVWPALSAVVAVEKSYVFMHAERRIVSELRRGGARILSIGGLIYFARENALRRNMERFAENAIRYLVRQKHQEPVTTWTPSDGIPREFNVLSAPLRPSRQGSPGSMPSSGLLLTRDHAGNEFYDLAGRRTLIMGRDKGGIDEVWVHPIRVLRDYEAGIVEGDSVAWLSNLPAAVEVRPESFTRHYTLPGGALTEIVYASFQRAGGVVQYESTIPVRLVIRFRADLRWMWPYDAGALGNLYYAYDRGLNALHVRDSSGSFACFFGADVAPRAHREGHYGVVTWSPQGLSGTTTTESQVAFGAEYALSAGRQGALSFAFVGTNEGGAAARTDYRALLERPDSALAEMVQHYRELLARSVSITSPDEEFNRLYPWAIVGADRFVAHTPGLGTGLLAGFSTVNRGWNGAQKISGRPGYAWYFGRDAAWSAFAFDAFGDFASVRNQLALYQKFQDASGKIYHELCTSGVVHFDASDATPLYVILAGHYLRASGDRAFIAASWTHVKRAMDFLLATDTDNDGLIENTDVGHGWVEPGGSLFGVHSELYLSVLWSEALRNAASIADLLGHDALSAEYGARAERVRRQLNTEFWDSGTDYFNYGKYADGTYNHEQTVFPAVGMLYAELDDAKAKPVLAALAANGFSTNWGVRILTSASQHFNPRSYQEGSVWPLMTGWTALGEYTYGNSPQAFSHVMDILLIKKQWALGFVQEVMHGAVYRPGGVCPHQCWSETNILHPVIEGMIGWKPDAVHASASLTPRFPLQWDTVSVTNLRVGKTTIAMAMERGLRRTTYRITRTNGPSCAVLLTPEIPASMEVTAVRVNGMPVPYDRTVVRGVLKTPIAVTLDGPQTVQLEHTGGIGMIPLIHHPVPGDSAAGVRIVAFDGHDGTYAVVVEGKQGTDAVLPLAIFDDALPFVQGAEIRWGKKPRSAELLVSFKPATVPVQQVVIRMQLR
jgi:glycogen debranching enzyme